MAVILRAKPHMLKKRELWHVYRRFDLLDAWVNSDMKRAWEGYCMHTIWGQLFFKDYINRV